jgi:Family of unknown function (DUF5343)
MAISTQSPAPYTAGSALVGLIRRFREKGLTAPFTADVLVRAGVSESLVPRTLQALQILDLMDDNGTPSPTLQKIRIASEKDYKACIADWIKSAYAEVFQFVDPTKDDAQSVRDAFRSYTPVGQQERMVALFYALCAEAGIVDESKKSEPKLAARRPPTQRVSSSAAQVRNKARDAHTSHTFSGSLPPALAGLMQSLPQPGTGWTREQRDRFIETFKSVLDFVVPVVQRTPVADANEERSP